VIYLFFDFYYCLSMSISDPKPVNRADRDQMVCWLSGRNAQKLRFCAKVVTKYISWQVRGCVNRAKLIRQKCKQTLFLCLVFFAEAMLKSNGGPK
jgi:hypothetical protein